MINKRALVINRPARLDGSRALRHSRAMVTIAPGFDADPLGDALHCLRMSGVFYCQSDLTAPWGAQVPPMPDCLMFHLVTLGQCWLSVHGDESRGGRWLQRGDFALVPHGLGHDLRSDPSAAAPDLFDLPRRSVSERYEVLRSGGGGSASRVICGAVRFEHPAARQLVALLPQTIVIDAASPQSGEWLPSLVHLMAQEAQHMRAGGDAVITRLADVLVIQAIRHWLRFAPNVLTGWLGALRDRRLGRALSSMHRDPARDWTVASLAEASAMSRSAFSQRFSDVVGMSAVEYLTRWRMNLAHDWLSQGRTIADVAAGVGYGSEAAFSRAFKRVIGAAPGAVRRAPTPARPMVTEDGPLNSQSTSPLGGHAAVGASHQGLDSTVST